MDEASAAKQAALADIEAQIQTLTKLLAETKATHEARLAPLHETRKATWAARWEAEKMAEAAVAAEFSDVANCTRAAAWKPYEDFLVG